ncbi:1,6-anhydro-N-acetylmuramyl-L-alanine amidase AmpD [Kangiella sp. TOML190]|uniref:1,6-anhydro-N-acetylmuramyl-L-alanine amidase AmpD n=1 Tax=Kangiella sp. TOML190 TaxID=2931351 RepID=UPI00203B3210|nr:1,6-anhydro-N-acetylmuramyl-L-alanine amidase AmpD [Kangiella sp. TOML190]
MPTIDLKKGLLTQAEQLFSPHFDEREDATDISLLVIHNISLPPNQFGGQHIKNFFQGHLDSGLHPYFRLIEGVRVSSHLLIQRDGLVIQFVPFHKRAWHAGVSSFEGREKCNDFSIGIELEGGDEIPFTSAQYQQLTQVTRALLQAYPQINQQRIVGHSDIAPERKTDPGRHFDWQRYFAGLG